MGKNFSKSDRLDATDLRVAMVVSRFNEELTSQLAADAFQCLEKNGAKVPPEQSEGGSANAEQRPEGEANIKTYWVPGAYEIPVVANELAKSGKFDAIIALGVVVEGETPHAQMIGNSTGIALLNIACESGVPVINEIVGTRNWEQAVARCTSSETSRGWYAAEAAIETANVLKQIREA